MYHHIRPGHLRHRAGLVAAGFSFTVWSQNPYSLLPSIQSVKWESWDLETDWNAGFWLCVRAFSWGWVIVFSNSLWKCQIIKINSKKYNGMYIGNHAMCEVTGMTAGGETKTFSPPTLHWIQPLERFNSATKDFGFTTAVFGSALTEQGASDFNYYLRCTHACLNVAPTTLINRLWFWLKLRFKY